MTDSPLVHDEPMDTSEVEESAPDRRFNDQGRRGRRRLYSLDTGYAETAPKRPWPDCLTVNDRGVCCDFDVWASHSHAPQFDAAKCPYMPFPWNIPSLREKLERRTNVHMNIVAALNPVPFYVYTPPVLLMLRGVKNGKSLTEVRESDFTTLSSDVILTYQRVIDVMQTQRTQTPKHPEAPLRPAQLEKIISVHEAAIEKHTEELVRRMESAGELAEAAAHYAEVGVNGPLADAAEERLLHDFLRVIVSWTVAHIQIMERRILFLTGRMNPDDLPHSWWFTRYAVPAPGAPYSQHMSVDTLTEQTSTYLKLAHEVAECSLPDLGGGFDMANHIHGVSVQALRALILLRCKPQ